MVIPRQSLNLRAVVRNAVLEAYHFLNFAFLPDFWISPLEKPLFIAYGLYE